MIRGPILAIIIATILVAFPSMFDAPIVEEKPLDCLQGATDLRLYRWGHYHDPVEIQDWQWQQLTAIEGADIWIGYDDGGWDAPDDIRGMWKITGVQNEQPIEIWLWRGDDYYYVFPFASTELYTDGNGEHHGMHPCGGWAINKLEILNIIARIMDNTSLGGGS